MKKNVKKNVKKSTKKELTDVYVITYVDTDEYDKVINIGTMMEAHSTFRNSYNYLVRCIEGFVEAEIKQSKDDVMDEYGTTDPKEIAKKIVVKNTLRTGSGELIVKFMDSTQHYTIDRIALKYVK